jgi:hypothetical protein
MTSDRQRAANRRNAQRSTGPRSPAGKCASRRNALRHGLSARLGNDPAHDVRVEALAKIIVGPDGPPGALHYARIAADATLQIVNIRANRTTMMEPSLRAREAFSWAMPVGVTWQRESTTKLLSLNVIIKRAMRNPGVKGVLAEPSMTLPPLKRFPPIPSGPEAEVEILGRFIGQVAKLDRYEARQLSRRRTALRALDALRASKAANS